MIAKTANSQVNHDHLVSEGGLEPPCPIRALAPQASASAYSATRTRDARGTHRLSHLSKPNAPRRVPRPVNPATPAPRVPVVLPSAPSSSPRGISITSWLPRRMSPMERRASAEGNASHISTTSTVPRQRKLIMAIVPAARRHGTGIPRRQNALDPGFHGVRLAAGWRPAGPGAPGS